MHHSNRRFLKACWKLTKISYYRRPHAPNAEDPTTGNLLYLYALPALALAFALTFAPARGLRALRHPLRPPSGASSSRVGGRFACSLLSAPEAPPPSSRGRRYPSQLAAS